MLAIAAAGLAASSALAQTGGIRNSAHNFSAYAWSGNEICRPCHIPHGGNVDAGALWHHTLSNATYTLFDSSTSAAGGADALDRVSLLCLSCHDGTVALDSFGGLTDGTTFIDSAPYDGAAKLGSDLRNDHPVGKTAVYTTSATSTSFNPQTITGAGTANERHKIYTPGSSTQSLSLYKMTLNGADAWVVGCKTCHDPHNNGTGAPAHMLRFSNQGSDLCLTCHIK
jgi:predicted CXXCH cytochrome family protein